MYVVAVLQMQLQEFLSRPQYANYLQQRCRDVDTTFRQRCGTVAGTVQPPYFAPPYFAIPPISRFLEGKFFIPSRFKRINFLPVLRRFYTF